MRIKVAEHLGVEIILDDKSEQFTAEVNGQTIKARSLVEIKRKMAKLGQTFEILDLGSSYFGIGKPDKHRVYREGKRLRDADTGDLLPKYGNYYHYDEQAEKKLDLLYEEYRALADRRNEIKRALKEVLE